MAAGTVGPARLPMVNRGALRRANSFSKLVLTHSEGTQIGVTELMSWAFLNAPVTIQYSGKRNRKARMTRTIIEKTL